MEIPEGIVIGAQLKKIRTAAGLTQRKLGEVSGINFRIIAAYENRQRNINIARVDIVKTLAQALNCKIEDLLDY